MHIGKQEYLHHVVVQVLSEDEIERIQREANVHIKWMDTRIKQEYLLPVVVQVVVKKMSCEDAKKHKYA